VARRYDEAFADVRGVIPPRAYADRRHVYHIYAVRVKDRDGFMKFLSEKGVSTAIHYPFAVHTLKGYSNLGYKAGDFPVAEEVAAEVVSLPMFPEMTDEMVRGVIAAVRDWSVQR
jgi:dTDP-4-amino-4,6-dideoxygalactose transaminase